MPTVLRYGPYRFFFYASDRNEPHHVDVERDESVAKFWLDPLRLHASGGFNRAELNRIRGIIEENHHHLLEAWNDYFGG
jgi:hypothetical protein